MPRALTRLLAVAATALVAALAVAGIALSALAALSAAGAGEAALARIASGQLERLFAGRLTAEAVRLSPRGAVELRGVRLRTPEGQTVAEVRRARMTVAVTRLARRELSVSLELEGPTILLDEAPDGSFGLVRALSPARPDASAEAPPSRGGASAGPAFRLEVVRLLVRGGAFRWVHSDGSTALQADAVELAAAGGWAAPAADAEVRLRLRAALGAPFPGPLVADGAARLRGSRFEVTRLEAALGATRAEAVGVVDVLSGAFRAALMGLGLAAADARRLASAAAEEDLSASGYAELDGALLSGALDVPPGGGARGAGSARAAFALRLGEGPAAGVDVALDGFDPSRVLAQAPAGRIHLAARGAVAGRTLADARGFVALELAPSRLRGREVGPVTLAARAA
ncbi:MAG TPA: hypothetical protein VFP65_29770, partial [Anaeromyxobacteraceae bacterium]|nr:hypothetical protein [Anaeromyxobacteraceae bacterium]